MWCLQDANAALKLELRQLSAQKELEEDAVKKAAKAHATAMAEREEDHRREVQGLSVASRIHLTGTA